MHGVRPHGCRSTSHRLQRCVLALAFVAAVSSAWSSLFAEGAKRRQFAQPPIELTGAAGEYDEDISDKKLQDPLADVRIEGNTTIQPRAIEARIKSRKGRPITRQEIQDDVASLLDTRWFYSVKPIITMTDDGPVLTYRLRERPMVRDVKFKGNKKLKTTELQAHIGISVGHGYDVQANREAVSRIKHLYQEKGYHYAEVELEKGNSPDDREVIFVIVEGPKVRVWWVTFEGNQFISDSVLRTKLATKNVILWYIGGDYEPEKIRNDLFTLTEYYHNLGFFDVKITHEEKKSEDRSYITVVFHIEEGTRYKVRSIDLAGYEVLSRNQLWGKPRLKQGDYFNARLMGLDVKHMKDQYDELGRLFAQVDPIPRFLDTPGELDLVYEINEDKPYLIGAVNAHIRGDHPHTREDVLLNNVARWARPGELANGRKLRMVQARIMGSNLWDQQEPPSFDIVKVDGKDYLPTQIARAQNSIDDVFGDSDSVADSGFGHSFSPPESRGRYVPSEVDASFLPPLWESLTPLSSPPAMVPVPTAAGLESDSAEPALLDAPLRAVRSDHRKPAVEAVGEVRLSQRHAVGKTPRPVRQDDISNAKRLEEPVAVAAIPDVNLAVTPKPVEHETLDPTALFETGVGQEPIVEPVIVRAQSQDVVRGQSIDRYGNPVPQNYLNSVSPQGNPYGNALRAPQEPGFVDVNVDVTEGRTGRLMFGVGVNSNAGVIGQFVLQEDNFDILRAPRSWSDIINGYAFRGAGQSFRLEAQPGTQVSRYMATWTDPFFLRTDFSLSVSGFYYTRFYNEWSEERLGGRLGLGYLLNEYWSVGASARFENVNILPQGATPPPSLEAVRGDNTLTTAQLTMTRDTRDNAFIPSSGNMFEASYEQGFGDFTYPRVELTGSQLFTVLQRPDGFGKHIVHLQGQVGWTGNDTPIFEKFYAGGYSSFRGFAFRGVSPVDNGYRVGGNFMMLGTAEYLMPVTASDSIRVVAFTDFGTVEPDVSIDDFRVTAGVGFRLTIPAMGPAPLAFDFAWPVLQKNTDQQRVFSFTVGFTR